MKIVMLCNNGTSSAIVFDKLSKKYEIEKVIVEGNVPKSTFLKRRIKKLGIFKVVGQMAFSSLVVPFLKKEAKNRRNEIIQKYDIQTDFEKIHNANTLFVPSVNSSECIQALKQIKPDIVIVNGTRIISKEVLTSIDATFINMHAGITPKYRGVHGAYWAYYNNDEENAGVTIHLVNEGIDTGSIIYQARIEKNEKDNFTTYTLIQTCVGVEYEINAIEDVINGRLKLTQNDLPSALYTHPTIFQYIYHRIRFGVK